MDYNKKPLTYFDKLKDPRWQRKRLEIFKRDDFSCQECGTKESTLHVHHLKYVKGKEPWEYEGDELSTLCEDCHRLRTQFTQRLQDYASGMPLGCQMAVLGFIYGMATAAGTDPGSLFSHPLFDKTFQMGMDAYPDVEKVFASRRGKLQ